MQAKVKVKATLLHPNRHAGDVYDVPEALAPSLAQRGFVEYPILPDEEAKPDPILPRPVKIIKPKAKAKKK